MAGDRLAKELAGLAKDSETELLILPQPQGLLESLVSPLEDRDVIAPSMAVVLPEPVRHSLARLGQFTKTVGTYTPAVEAVVRQLGSKSVPELQCLTAALYVARERPDSTPEEQAARVRQLHARGTHLDALAALEFVRSFQTQAAPAA